MEILIFVFLVEAIMASWCGDQHIGSDWIGRPRIKAGEGCDDVVVSSGTHEEECGGSPALRSK